MSESVVDAGDVEESVTQVQCNWYKSTWRLIWDMKKDPW